MGFFLPWRALPLVALLITAFYATPLLEKPARNPSELVFWAVGQGDFITLTAPQGCWIFDCGGGRTPPRKTLNTLRNCPRHTAQLFASHFDEDHIRHWARLKSYVTISDIYVSHLKPKSKFGKSFLVGFQKLGAEIHVFKRGMVKKLGPLTLTSLWPPVAPPELPNGGMGMAPHSSEFRSEPLKTENDRSEVLLLKASHFSALLTGDLPARLEKFINVPLEGLPVDILKLGHHGSRTSSSIDFLKRLRPRTCIVSVGQNSYGHPNQDTLERATASHCAVMRTDRLGDLHFNL